VLADVLPSTHEILTDMPMSPLYHTQCLWNPDNKGWIPIKLIHPMNDLDISFVKEGIVAFPNVLRLGAVCVGLRRGNCAKVLLAVWFLNFLSEEINN
jgi:hypothetical protein